MPIITNSNLLATAFAPAVGDFNVQCTGGEVMLQRRNAAAAAWSDVGVVNALNPRVVSNPVAGAEYQFVWLGVGSPVVRADQ